MSGKDKNAVKNAKSALQNTPSNLRYEYRVWGKHRKACRALARLSSAESSEEIQDWYVLVDDPDWNAKVRGSGLKLKYLVSNKRGFERWSSKWHRDAAATPAPFDSVFEDLSLDRVQRDKRYELADAVARLDEDARARVVSVTKHRRRYRIGSIKAEVTKMDIEGSENRLHSVAIQGDNLNDLIELLRSVGLDGEPNVPVHTVIGDAVIGDAVIGDEVEAD